MAATEYAVVVTVPTRFGARIYAVYGPFDRWPKPELQAIRDRSPQNCALGVSRMQRVAVPDRRDSCSVS